MDVHNINKYNVVMNAISGNFFPTSGVKIDLGIVRKTYIIFTWVIEAMYLSSTTLGLLCLVSPIVAARDGGVSAIVSVEVMILLPYLTRRSDRLRNIIGKINGLIDDSDLMRRCIRESVEPHKNRLKIITSAIMAATGSWACLPLTKMLDATKTSFGYTDFVIPTYYPGAPFTPTVFFCGITVQIMGAIYLGCKKSAVDVYMCYIMSLLIAQYRYVHDELIIALDPERNDTNEELIDSLKKCIRHHCACMEIGQMINELFSVNVALIYINSILRFCFSAISILTLPDIQDKVVCILYLSGTMTQVFCLCLCVQELLDVHIWFRGQSTTVTDDAFHGNWYGRGKTVKKIFRTMGLGNDMECRLTAYRVVDLTVPTFGSILNGAYSVLLILLRAV